MKSHIKSIFDCLMFTIEHRFCRRVFGFILLDSGETPSGTSGLGFRLNGANAMHAELDRPNGAAIKILAIRLEGAAG